jgi:hypothetical protein
LREDDTERDMPVPHSETGHERTSTMLPKRRSRTPWFVGGGVALLVLGFLGARFIHGMLAEPDATPPAAPTTIAPPQQAPAVEAVAEPPTASVKAETAEPAGTAAPQPEPPKPVVAQQVQDDVAVSFASTPPDAEVKEGDAVLGRTPFDLAAPRATLAGRTFVVAKDGFEPVTVTASAPTGATLPLEVTLTPKAPPEQAVAEKPPHVVEPPADHKPKSVPKTPKITKPKNDPLDIKLTR